MTDKVFDAAAHGRAMREAGFWQDKTIGSIHWESPVVANGVLYLTDESMHLTAYSAVTLPAPALPRGGAWAAALALLGAGMAGHAAAYRFSRHSVTAVGIPRIAIEPMDTSH